MPSFHLENKQMYGAIALPVLYKLFARPDIDKPPEAPKRNFEKGLLSVQLIV